jgi:hypothetical protein
MKLDLMNMNGIKTAPNNIFFINRRKLSNAKQRVILSYNPEKVLMIDKQLLTDSVN